MDRFVVAHTLPGLLQDLQVQILDARPQAAFLASHIAGALHTDLVTPKFLIRSPQELQAFHDALQSAIGAAGLDPNRPVVVYDAGQESRAARTAWMLEYAGFRVGLLQGGFGAYQATGLPVTSGLSLPEPTRPTLRPRPELLAVADDVLAALGGNNTVILDARNNDEFAGLLPASGRAGRIPGALQLEWTRVMDATGFKTGAALDEVLQNLPTGHSVIVHCASGARSSVLYHALRERGFAVRNYLGSMNEWLADETLPIKKGPA